MPCSRPGAAASRGGRARGRLAWRGPLATPSAGRSLDAPGSDAAAGSASIAASGTASASVIWPLAIRRSAMRCAADSRARRPDRGPATARRTPRTRSPRAPSRLHRGRAAATCARSPPPLRESPACRAGRDRYARVPATFLAEKRGRRLEEAPAKAVQAPPRRLPATRPLHSSWGRRPRRGDRGSWSRFPGGSWRGSVSSRP